MIRRGAGLGLRSVVREGGFLVEDEEDEEEKEAEEAGVCCVEC